VLAAHGGSYCFFRCAFFFLCRGNFSLCIPQLSERGRNVRSLEQLRKRGNCLNVAGNYSFFIAFKK